MPSNISRARRQKAFDEGRRSATEPKAINPYENPKLKTLWDDGRTKQQAGELKTPLAALERGKTRARPANKSPGPRPQGLRPASGMRNPEGRDRQRRPRPRPF